MKVTLEVVRLALELMRRCDHASRAFVHDHMWLDWSWALFGLDELKFAMEFRAEVCD